MIGNISTHRMKNFLQEFTAFHTRYFKSATGAEAARWLLSELQYIAKKSSHNSANISIKTFENPWGQFSIIARLYPRTQNDRLVVQRSAPTSFFSTDHNDDNSIPTVILGAHLDSINQWNPWFGRAPGADDDGSGTAALVEVFRLLVTHNFKPQRPVELHFYSAEEGGLLGSQRIAADYAKLQVPVFSMYQIDMTGFVPPNKAPIIGVATDNVSIELAKVIKVLVKTYCSIESADVQCGYETIFQT